MKVTSEAKRRKGKQSFEENAERLFFCSQGEQRKKVSCSVFFQDFASVTTTSAHIENKMQFVCMCTHDCLSFDAEKILLFFG